MQQASPSTPTILRTAAVWGTTVLAVRSLNSGESFELGDGENRVVPKPDGSGMADLPVRAVGAGWELDARGATGGLVYLRGRAENPAELGRIGAPIPIVIGDHGLIQYGAFSVFFQFSNAPPELKRRRRTEWSLVLAFVFATIAVLGALALIYSITTPPPIPKPLELTTDNELAVQYNLKTEPEPVPPPSAGKEEAKAGQGVKDPGAKEKKPIGGGRKAKQAEGRLGKQGDREVTEQTGEIKHALGGMADVLSSDVGEEVKKTLGTISSVADALGGLRSDKIVLGRGTGLGLKGSNSGGGGNEEGGVPFGAGTLDTGWGAGRGGGLGAGSGGPGGPGSGGLGRGGKGRGDADGDGTGTAERKLTGKDVPKPGQGLSPGQIARVVMSRYGAFRACYEAAAARDPSMSGSVSVSWSITPGGSVSGANLASSSLGNARVEGCILRQFSRLKFPSADKPTNAVWPFVFRPGKK
jgi:hypothetical protein